MFFQSRFFFPVNPSLFETAFEASLYIKILKQIHMGLLPLCE